MCEKKIVFRYYEKTYTHTHTHKDSGDENNFPVNDWFLSMVLMGLGKREIFKGCLFRWI